MPSHFHVELEVNYVWTDTCHISIFTFEGRVSVTPTAVQANYDYFSLSNYLYLLLEVVARVVFRDSKDKALNVVITG